MCRPGVCTREGGRNRRPSAARCCRVDRRTSSGRRPRAHTSRAGRRGRRPSPRRGPGGVGTLSLLRRGGMRAGSSRTLLTGSRTVMTGRVKTCKAPIASRDERHAALGDGRLGRLVRPPVLHLLVRRQALISGEHVPAPAAQQRAVRAVLEQPSLGEQGDGPDASVAAGPFASRPSLRRPRRDVLVEARRRVVGSPRAARTAELDAHVGDELGERARIHGLDHRVRDLRRVGVGSMPGDAEGGDDDDVDGAVGPAGRAHRSGLGG